MSLVMDIKKRYPGFVLDMQLEAGEERVALLGASGCGKSCTLRCIAGVETPDEGKIVVNGAASPVLCVPTGVASLWMA